MLDGEDVTQQLKKQGVYDGFHAYAQRCFMTNEERAKYYGLRGYVGTTSAWNNLDYVTTDEAKETLKTGDFGTYDAEVARAIDLGFEGIPFLGYPKNFALCKMAGISNPVLSWGILPPSTKVVVQLRRPTPRYKYLEQHTLAVNENNEAVIKKPDQDKFFSKEAMTDPLFEYEVNFKDIALGVEVFKFHPTSSKQMLAKYSKNKMSYHFDSHDMQVQRIPEGQKEPVVSFNIDKNVKLAVLNFAFQPNVHWMKSTNHNLSYRCVLPKFLESLKIEFQGEPIIAEELSKLYAADASSTPIESVLRRYLEDRNWFDTDHPEDFITRTLADKSFKFIIPLDLSAFEADGPRDLTVTMRFKEANTSPAALFLMCDRIYEATLTRTATSNSKTEWTVSTDVSYLPT